MVFNKIQIKDDMSLIMNSISTKWPVLIKIILWPGKIAFKLSLIAFLSGTLFLTQVHGQYSDTTNSQGAWQNPNIGFALDITTDASDIDSTKEWTSAGVNIRSAELALESNIDPFSRLNINLNFSEKGAAIHETYFLLHSLPGSLQLKGGHMLTRFGRWNQFHTHAMPFLSEPRIYQEYFGGHFSANGLELSWLLPLRHYIEATFSVYENISGHSHDSDPTPSGFTSAIDLKAAELGYTKHGSHYHAPDGSIILASELDDSASPQVKEAGSNKRAEDLVIGGRLKTTFELGDNWSIDWGSSMVYQKNYKFSQRINGKSYSKAVYGTDITVFWHPLTSNRHRNLNFGIEFLGNYEGFERLENGELFADTNHRFGFFSHLHMQINPTWHSGIFGELYQAKEGEKYERKRYGYFLSYYLSHFQFIRIEYSYFDKYKNLRPNNRIQLQYDAVIGYHTHGSQR